MSFAILETETENVWLRKFGIRENPFPPSGVSSSVFFGEHLTRELLEVKLWVNQGAQRADRASYQPLAIEGSLGVGKTHLLKTIHRELRLTQRAESLYCNLTDQGSERLLLSSLLLNSLRDFQRDRFQESPLPLLKVVMEKRDELSEISSQMENGDPLKAPLLRIANDPELEDILARWLLREYTTPSQRAKIGVSGMLDAEGAAIRAFVSLIRTARQVGAINSCFVLIDQLEELWRPRVVTDAKRARFLTDVRLLVDLGLAGAPINVLLAWNTRVDLHSTEERLKEDYRALSQRLTQIVHLPGLHRDLIWPFADAYLRQLPRTAEVSELSKSLKAQESRVWDRVLNDGEAVLGANVVTPRGALKAWRTTAEELIST